MISRFMKKLLNNSWDWKKRIIYSLLDKFRIIFEMLICTFIFFKEYAEIRISSLDFDWLSFIFNITWYNYKFSWIFRVDENNRCLNIRSIFNGGLLKEHDIVFQR